MNRYLRVDKFIEKVKKQIRKEYNYLLVTGFDELNVVTTANKTKAQYKRMKSFNEREYQEIAKDALKTAQSLLTASEKRKANGIIAEDIVEDTILGYNAVTGYLYEPESERKRLRQAEEMMTAVTFQDRQMYEKALKRSANLWAGQSAQYALDITDNTYLETFKMAGVKKVQWITKIDGRECEICRERHMKVYPIDKVPKKPHPNCRCIQVPLRDEK